MYPHILMKRFRPNSEAGTSLIELLTVLVVTMILVAIVASRYGSANQIITRQNVTRNLKSSLDRARADSVKRRPVSPSAMSRVLLNSASSFTLLTDQNVNGVLESGESTLVNFNSSETRLVSASLIFPVAISFDKNGFATAVDGNGYSVAPVFSVCDRCVGSDLNVSNSSTITVSPTGTTVITDGPAVTLAVDPSGVSSVATSSGVRSGAVIAPPASPQPCNLLPILCL